MKCRYRNDGSIFLFVGHVYDFGRAEFVAVFAENSDSGCMYALDMAAFERDYEMMPDTASVDRALRVVGRSDLSVISLGALQLLNERGIEPSSTELIQAYHRSRNRAKPGPK